MFLTRIPSNDILLSPRCSHSSPTSSGLDRGHRFCRHDAPSIRAPEKQPRTGNFVRAALSFPNSPTEVCRTQIYAFGSFLSFISLSISYILPAPLQDLFAQLRAQQEAQDAENKRRREWECQLELAAAARQAQAERTISEMREEIEHLRAALHASQQRVSYHQENGLLTPYHSSSSVEPMPSHYHSVTPLSPISRQATFASGISAIPCSLIWGP